MAQCVLGISVKVESLSKMRQEQIEPKVSPFEMSPTLPNPPPKYKVYPGGGGLGIHVGGYG